MMSAGAEDYWVLVALAAGGEGFDEGEELAAVVVGEQIHLVPDCRG
jgi:hypothetical protein